MNTNLDESDIEKDSPLLIEPDSDPGLTSSLEGRDLKALMTYVKINLPETKKDFDHNFLIV